MQLPHVRTLFRDGERLTAARLNAAFQHARDALRRTLVGPLSPGVALGLSLRGENDGRSVVITPGIAIDRRGRIAVLAAPKRFTRSDLEREVGPLGDGDVVRVGVRVATVTPTDPCEPDQSTERAEIVFRRITPPPGGPLASAVHVEGATLDVAVSCVPAWGDLDLRTHDPDGCSVQLGTLSAGSGTQVLPSMEDRQGIAPRFDALRNSFEQVVIELRTRAGQPRVHFVAPAGGADVQATRLARAHSRTAAARVSPSDGGVAELAGGVAPRAALPGGLPAGLGGLLTMPLALQPDTGEVSVGTVVELYQASSGEAEPIAPGAVRPMTDPARAIGLVGAPSYTQRFASDGPPTTVAPLAVAGLLGVQVEAVFEFGFDAGQPLTPQDATTLRAADTPGDLIVAVAAQAVRERSFAYVFPVHPPRRFGG